MNLFLRSSTTGRYCFHRCLSVHKGGGGVSQPTQQGGGGSGPADGGGGGVQPRQDNIGSTCYTAGGMPLAFTQEDFFVLNVLNGTSHIITLDVITPLLLISFPLSF